VREEDAHRSRMALAAALAETVQSRGEMRWLYG